MDKKLYFSVTFLSFQAFINLTNGVLILSTLFLRLQGVYVSEARIINASSLIAQNGGFNWFQGQWLPDDSYPLYQPLTCPFVEPYYDCIKFGRPDKQFLKYYWKPDFCNLPRFDGNDFLTRWKGKRIMFVGDSIGSNSWQSLLCMIHASVPNIKYSTSQTATAQIVNFDDYGVSIQFYRSNFLVDIVQENGKRILKLDSIEGGNEWRDMDMLIFNSWHWYSFTGQVQPWDYIQYGSTTVQDMDRLTAYNKGLDTWAQWVEQTVDPAKTKVYFRGISPVHYNGKEWNSQFENCKGEQTPLKGSTYPAGKPPEAGVMNKVAHSIKKPVYLLDIMTLSQLRIDGHPSAYSGGDGHLENDCTHWCLPGVPDTWTNLLYATLIQGNDWNSISQNCMGEQQPLPGPMYPAGQPPEDQVVKKVLGSMKKPVYLLDIMTLTQLRKDGHPSIYGGEDSGNDSAHWCLPGSA